MTQILCLLHTMDPRGAKLGGIETHVRHVIRHHPSDMRIVFVGVDERGDLPLGAPASIEVFGRRIVFLPVARESADVINRAATRLTRSITLRTALGALRHWRTIRRLTAGAPASAELQRNEFAPLAWSLGLPAVQIVHNEGTRKDKMDSLLKRFWFVHAAAERLALRLAARIMGVNDSIVARIRRDFPRAAAKTAMMTVSVDHDIFRPQPFPADDGEFRVMFAGRLDEFKDPPLMFRVFRRLHKALGGRFAFHYVGMTDPERYAEFADISGFTVRHGFQTSEGVARIAAQCHAGVLTSYFEGMPCYLLETLSIGRPFAAIRLPQYDPLIVQGVSGVMVERGATADASEEAMTQAFLGLRRDISDGLVDPQTVAALTDPYSVKRQLVRLFDWHRAIARPARTRPAPSPGSREPRAESIRD